MEAMQAAKAVPITERLRNIKIGSYTVDHGSHTKHIAVRAICEEAAQEIDQLKGECLMLADVLRDAYAVVKTIEGEDSDECDKLSDLRMSMEYALAMYDKRRIETANAIGQRGAACGASAAPTGCASNGKYNERTEK